VNPAEFSTLDYSVRYADALVAAGYIAIHPNLRGYGPSENGENILGIGDTIDVLTLIALVRQQAGSDGLLKTADSSRIGLWGHSMGGGIVMRALIVDQDIRAGLLYASVNADETINLSHFEKDGRGNTKIDAPRGILNLLSPKDYLDRIAAPLSIHHGGEDEVVPISWSRNLCAALEAMGKSVECREYPDQPHTFKNDGDGQFIRAMVEFYDQHLR
jgi:dipeptidyl aminopeptidase/acylaminoacyl peptidase